MIEGPAKRPAGGGRWGPVGRWGGQVRSGMGAVAQWIGGARRGHAVDPFLTRLQVTDRILWIALVLLGSYVALDLVLVQPRLPVLRSRQATPPGEAAAPGAVAESLKPVTAYQETIAARNPFQLASVRSASVLTETSEDRLFEMVKILKVVGINRGAHPEALIEDVDAGRTHFVRVGDRVNGLDIVAIDEQGVVVRYEGEETRLE